MPPRARPEVPRKPLPPFWSLCIFPGTRMAGKHLCKFPSQQKLLSWLPVAPSQVSPSSAFSLFSPDKVTLCLGWRFCFDRKESTSLMNICSYCHWKGFFYLSKGFFVFYLCLVVSSRLQQSFWIHVANEGDLLSFMVFTLKIPLFSKFLTDLMTEAGASPCFFCGQSSVWTITADPIKWIPRAFSLHLSPNIFLVLSETEMHFMQIPLLRSFQEY